MQYVCLVYLQDGVFDGMPERQQQALTNESLDYDDELRERGHFITASALQPVSAATTVRVRNGRLSATDGPFAETKEHLAGFIFIEARDLNEAIQVATRIPVARVGSVEVRPVLPLQRTNLDS
jgi:hypothetical protein